MNNKVCKISALTIAIVFMSLLIVACNTPEGTNVIDTSVKDTSSEEEVTSDIVSSSVTFEETSSNEVVSSSEVASSSEESSSQASSSDGVSFEESEPCYRAWYSCDAGKSYIISALNVTGYTIDSVYSSSGSTAKVVYGSTDVDFFAPSQGQYTLTSVFVFEKTGKKVTCSTTLIVDEQYSVEEIFPDIPDIDTGF